jgi:multiple sugar transport system substrate-binding protein
MWLTDPDVSTRSILVVSGFADPYRYNHLRDERARVIYTPQALDSLAEQLKNVVPAGTGLPGDAEYIDALSRNLWLAAAGTLSASEAMRTTAEQWEKITESYGREKQKGYWRVFREKFPQQAPQ